MPESNRLIINQKEFYGQSDALLNQYLKDTPAHIQKYAEEISDAEKTLHDNWIKVFEFDKAGLEKGLSDNVLVQWQYYEQLGGLAEKYYNTAGASYGRFADEYEEVTREIKEGQKKLWEDVFGELNTQLDGLQSACGAVKEAVKEYSENQNLSIDTVQKLMDLEPQYLKMLFDENGQLQLNEEAYKKLARVKLEEMKADLAYRTLNIINGLESEAQAVETLTGRYAELRDTSLGAVEAMLQVAVAEAHKRGAKQGEAADMMMDAYRNQKKVIDMADFSLPSLTGEKKEEEKEFLKTFDWIAGLLEKISDKTSKLIDKIEKFYSWQKKNSMINRAVKATDKEVNLNELAYQAYMKKADKVKLPVSYKNKVQNGTLSIEDITDEKLSDRIDKYKELYEQAQDCLKTIEDLYDRQRDLIKQKLDNVLDYYKDMDSYLSSVTSKLESIISLNDAMGRRSSLTELVEQFAAISERMNAASAPKDMAGTAAAAESEASPGDAQSAAEAAARDRQAEADKIKGEIADIQANLENSATYKNFTAEIEKTKARLAKLDEKGCGNLTKSQKKTYDALQAQLEAHYEKKKALDENATAANIAEYSKIYDAWKKLQDKLDKGRNLSTGEWQKYNRYKEQLEGFAADKSGIVSELNGRLDDALNPGDKLEEIKETHEEAAKGIYDSYQSQISRINGETENTQQYQKLLAEAQKLEQKKDTKGLSKNEQAKLDKHSAELEALRKGAAGSNISEYMKKWEALYKLQQKLDGGKKLSAGEAKTYDEYKAQLEAWNKEKQTQIDDLTSRMEDDLEQLNKTYTENVSEAESETNGYYAELYSLAKQIAEFNNSELQAQLDLLESSISYHKELLSLYDSFSGDKLSKILTDLDESALREKSDVYEGYLKTLTSKYDTTLAEINEYKQLLEGLDTNDFESSMTLFNKAIADYRSKGNDAIADKLQSVMKLLDERAISADNWGGYADEWAMEWEKALSSARQELIGTASEIQAVNDALREIRIERITDAADELKKSADILSSIAGLIQDEWLFEPDGSISEYGRAKAALLASQLEDAQAAADRYLDLYAEIEGSRDTYASEKDYLNARNEALQNYYDSLGKAASLENSIVELMKKGSEAELNNIKKIIDSRKRALQAKKEYYDYDKSLKNSQKEIDSLKAQIDALESLGTATDAATKAKLAQLKADLREKEDALQETKDEHAYQLQMDALDKFADTLTESIDNSTKSVSEILKEQKDIVESAKDLYRASADSVHETIGRLEAFHGGTGVYVGSDAAAAPDGTAGAADTAGGSALSGDISPSAKNSSALSEVKDAVQSIGRQAESMNNGLKVIEPAVNRQAEDMRQIMELSMAAMEKGILLALPDNCTFNVRDLQMLNLMQGYTPKMINAAAEIPNYINALKQEQPEINIRYDNLINVEGSIDKDFAKVFPDYLKEACEYTKRNIYSAQRRLR